MEVYVLYKDKNFIDCKVGGSIIGEECFITWVYGDPEPSQRTRNWEQLTNIGRNHRVPWMCASDFNDISQHSEKIGGRRKDQCKIDQFNKLIEDIQMEDLGFKGQMQTWTNNRRGADWVMERLDRVLVNRAWGSICPQALCVNGLIVRSDHAPLEIIMELNEQRGPRIFRFEEMWFKRVDCFEVIKNAWSREGHIGELGHLKENLTACKSSLTEWSKREFKHNIME